MAGLYLHIPFCKRPCGYCDFYKSFAVQRKPELLDALGREMTARRDFLGDSALRTIYFGGGTPTVCTPDELGALLDRIRRLWECSGVTETTIEANPDDVDEPYLLALRHAGFDRLSLGIQSFDDARLRTMNRRHDAAQSIAAIRAARRAGFDNLSLDLIWGLPGMTLQDWSETIDRTLEFAPEHLSAYLLSYEPGTPFYRRMQRGELLPASDTESIDQYRLLCERLRNAGYEHYEISNFALPGRRARHNSAYWTGEPYLGLGPGAHSFDGRRRCLAVSSLTTYLTGSADAVYQWEELSETDRYNEFVMLSLRRREGIDPQRIATLFGARKLQYFTESAARLLRDGQLEIEHDHYRIPEAEWLLSDRIIADLFWVAADGIPET